MGTAIDDDKTIYPFIAVATDSKYYEYKYYIVAKILTNFSISFRYSILANEFLICVDFGFH